MKRFYLNDTFIVDQIIDVPHEIVHHIHALRLSLGEAIELFDGKNQTYRAEIINLNKRSINLKIIDKTPVTPTSPIGISLAIALVANDKMDLIIQKAVELGVNNIIPIHSERSARLIAERGGNRLLHWQNIIISSCCQCGQNILPTIDLPIPLNLLYERSKEYALKVVMNPHTDLEFSSKLNSDIKDAILLVGPEGGFSMAEAEQARVHNYQTLQLGKLIMRSETAVITGLSTLNLFLGKYKIS